MKKIFLFSFILIVTMGMVYSAGINVTSPAAGVTWYKGSTHNITWSGAGCGNPNVKINIFKSPISQANFTGVQLTATLASHSKSWTVPGSFANGSYIIRVKSADSACYGDSGVFTITDAPATGGSLTITNPHAGTQWCKGTTKNITWTSSGSLSANVKINIFKGSITPANFVKQLIAPTASGSKSWVIPSNAEPGTYFIRIKEDKTGGLHWDSPGFIIKSCGSGGTPGRIPDWIKDKLRNMARLDWRRVGPRPPGPGPCLSCPPEFFLEKYINILKEHGIKGKVGVRLFKGQKEVADLGVVGQPALEKVSRLRSLRGNVMQSRMKLLRLAPEKSRLLGTGGGYRLVFNFANGESVVVDNVKLNELKGKRGRR